jgi:hypothetical protein
MYRLYTWYRDGTESVKEPDSTERIANTLLKIGSRNKVFAGYLRSNQLVFPCDEIPTDKFEKFSILNPIYIIAIINTKNGEVTLFEKGIVKKYESENAAKIACGIKTGNKVMAVHLKEEPN